MHGGVVCVLSFMGMLYTGTPLRRPCARVRHVEYRTAVCPALNHANIFGLQFLSKQAEDRAKNLEIGTLRR